MKANELADTRLSCLVSAGKVSCRHRQNAIIFLTAIGGGNGIHPAAHGLLCAASGIHQLARSASEVNESAKNSSFGNWHWATKSRCADSITTGAPQAYT